MMFVPNSLITLIAQAESNMTDEQYQLYVTKTGELDIDALFWTAIEEQAAELEITVDYYLAEFM
jgi:hypothetical protein